MEALILVLFTQHKIQELLVRRQGLLSMVRQHPVGSCHLETETKK